MIKIHYHSDCSFFAGCESMLANFFNSKKFQSLYQLSFSYSYSRLYEEGFNNRIQNKIPIYPFFFPALTDYGKLPKFIPLVLRKIIMAGLRFFFHFPLLIYEIFILYNLLRKISPEILHINNGSYPGARSALAASIAGKIAGIKIVVMVVNNMTVSYRHYSRWFDYPIDRVIVRCVSVFITGSKAANDRLKTVLNLPPHKLQRIHNGIALNRKFSRKNFSRDNLQLTEFNGVIYGVISILIPKKGHQVLLDAVLMITRNNNPLHNNFKIIIEGDGPLRQILEDFVIANNLTSWVLFTGKLENIFDLMSIIDVLILPSIEGEDLPNVVSEAMAFGKPVISSYLAGTPEQVTHGVTGLLVEPRNVGQLVNAIINLNSDANMRKSMGCKAVERFNNFFTSDIAIHNYINLYARLIQDLL